MIAIAPKITNCVICRIFGGHCGRTASSAMAAMAAAAQAYRAELTAKAEAVRRLAIEKKKASACTRDKPPASPNTTG
jgi:hypothetical protein